MPAQTRGGNTVKANHTYLSDGAKASILNASGEVYDYNGSFIFSRSAGGSRTLESVAFSGGRIRKSGSGYTVDYYITDHLGSVRAIVNASGAIVEQNDYYPFGARHANGLSTVSGNRWRFSGKEEYDSAFGIAYDDFGARLYDRTAWTAIDPLAEKYYSVSPYSYCAGNPVRFVDLDGLAVVIWYKENGQQKSFFYSGNEIDIPQNNYVRSFVEAYKYNKDNWINAGYVGDSPSTILVENKTIKVSVFEDIGDNSQYFQENGGIPYIRWNSYEGTKTDLGIILSPASILAHEADHAIDDLKNAIAHSKRRDMFNPQYDNNEEERVISNSEQKTAYANGEVKKGQVTRRNHRGETVITEAATSNVISKIATDYYKKYKRR